MYPNRGTPRFFGRTDELEQLRESLKIHNSVRLHGIPGVGKTSLALRFANQSESDYNMIFWMECEPSSALDQSCHEALSRLGVIDAKQKPGVELRQRWREFLTQTCMFVNSCQHALFVFVQLTLHNPYLYFYLFFSLHMAGHL